MDASFVLLLVSIYGLGLLIQCFDAVPVSGSDWLVFLTWPVSLPFFRRGL